MQGKQTGYSSAVCVTNYALSRRFDPAAEAAYTISNRPVIGNNMGNCHFPKKLRRRILRQIVYNKFHTVSSHFSNFHIVRISCTVLSEAILPFGQTQYPPARRCRKAKGTFRHTARRCAKRASHRRLHNSMHSRFYRYCTRQYQRFPYSRMQRADSDPYPSVSHFP